MTIPTGYQQLEGSERQIAPGAHLLGPADPNEVLSISIYVRPRAGAPPLPDHEYWMANPPGQRRFLTRSELAETYSAEQADLDQVVAFARAHGLTVEEVDAARRLVAVSGTVQQMNQAFAVELGRYESPSETYRGREGYVYLPDELVGIVEGVFGLDNRPVNRPRPLSGGGGSFLSPAQVGQFYDFPPINASGQTIGIIEFGGGWVVDAATGRPTDIDLFFQANGLPTPNLTAVSVDGQHNRLAGSRTNISTTDPDAEVVLDIAVAGSIAVGANIVVYFTPNTQRGYVDVLSKVLTDTVHAPSVLSISWGGAEDVDFTSSDLNQLSQLFRSAAAAGITVFVSSGDNGTDDQVGDGKAHVEYPASDPWVTACGGAVITNTTQTPFIEISWVGSSGTTGGGVSTHFQPPGWQAQSEANVPPSINDHTTRGRGVPDIAGHVGGYGLWLYGGSPPGSLTVTSGSAKGQHISSFIGTSAVAPLYAGLIAMINAALPRPVGFLNPTLYFTAPNSNVFKDINDGSSNAFAGAPGYLCGRGWDACTGWGSIDGTILAKVLGVPRAALGPPKNPIAQVRLQIEGFYDPAAIGTPAQAGLVGTYAEVEFTDPSDPSNPANLTSVTLVIDGTFEGYEVEYLTQQFTSITIEIAVWRSAHSETRHGKIEEIKGKSYIVFGPDDMYPLPSNWNQLSPYLREAALTETIDPPVPSGFVHTFTLSYNLATGQITGDATGAAGETITTNSLPNLSVTFVITQLP